MIKTTVRELLEYSIKYNLKHIPSALSQFSYLKFILPLIKDKFKIVIGKPFGSQAYYVIWEKMYNLPKKLSYGVKSTELDFIEYSEETLGNAVGIAAGIAIAQNKPIYCNISDGCLQMGATLEALQFIGANKLDVFITIDWNNFQLTDTTKNIMDFDIEKYQSILINLGFFVKIIDTEKIQEIKIPEEFPVCFLMKTKKGQGVKEMEDDPVLWHYKELKSIKDINIRKEGINEKS